MSARAVARGIVVPPARLAARGLVRARTSGWPDHSRLFALGDRSSWSVEEDAEQLASDGPAARVRGRPAALGTVCRAAVGLPREPLRGALTAVARLVASAGHRISARTAWNAGISGVRRRLRGAAQAARRIERIQVTHAEMHELVLSAGVDPARVFRIPIGIDLEHFPLVESREPYGSEACARAGRRRLRGRLVPEGRRRLGRGPRAEARQGPGRPRCGARAVRGRVPELVVLLTGPARGYVRSELDRLGIPHRHVLARGRAGSSRARTTRSTSTSSPRARKAARRACSRRWRAGVPLVTTRVGQAPDIVDTAATGSSSTSKTRKRLPKAVLRVREDRALAAALTAAGRRTAEEYAYERLDARWERLLDGFVVRKARNATD